MAGKKQPGKNGNRAGRKQSISEKQLAGGLQLIRSHSLFGYLLGWLDIRDKTQMGKNAAVTDKSGHIYLNKDVLLSEKQWSFVIAHCLLHLAFGHFDAERMPNYEIYLKEKQNGGKQRFDPFVWNMACDICIDRFLTEIKFGEPLCDTASLQKFGGSADELSVYQRLMESDTANVPQVFGTAEAGKMDMQGLNTPIEYKESEENQYVRRFGESLSYSVSEALGKAAGVSTGTFDPKHCSTPLLAARWFMNSYPLLGGLAASFTLVEDRSFCLRNEISIAEIDVGERKIYLNPLAEHQYSKNEWRFILAHEYLHAGLKHRERCQGRNPYL